ncbi:hypothetical protein QQF64_022695 [Cirrhinus molitorella]|uniref:Uncharacterized protein n=1 Tax=Cirrhinus molitorella TaxID=172907 RepID=A0ABR3L6M1_9TELE
MALFYDESRLTSRTGLVKKHHLLPARKSTRSFALGCLYLSHAAPCCPSISPSVVVILWRSITVCGAAVREDASHLSVSPPAASGPDERDCGVCASSFAFLPPLGSHQL